MCGALVALSAVKELLDPSGTVARRVQEGVELLNRGDSPGFGIHEYRYQAKSLLLEVLRDLVSWRRLQAAGAATTAPPQTTTASNARGSGSKDRSGSFVWTVVALHVMYLVGKALFDAAETLDGFQWAAESCSLLHDALTSGVPLTAEDVEKCCKALLTEKSHVARQHRQLMPTTSTASRGGDGGAPLDDDSTHALLLPFASGGTLFLEQLTFLGAAWTRWGDETMALRMVQKAQQFLPLLLRAETEGKKRRLLHDSAQRHAQQQQRLESERDAQLAAMAARLEQKRKDRSSKASAATTTPPDGALPSSTTTASLAPPPSATDTSTTATSSTAVEAPPSESRSEAANGSRPDATAFDVPWLHWTGVTADRLRDGTAEDALWRVEVLCALWSCHGQILRGHPDSLQLSAYFCHRSLANRLALLRTDEERSSWVSAALSLAEWYLLSADLSHAEHCLCAAKVLGSSVPNAVTFDATYYHYLFATLQARLLVLMQRVVEDDGETSPSGKALTQLYDNPLLPPDDVNGTAGSAVPAWSVRERIAFSGLKGLLPPRKELLVETRRSPESVEASRAVYATFAASAAACRETVTLDTDCERFLELARSESDVCRAMYVLTGELEWLESRRVVLQQILASELNRVAFRNVLRQAEYDLGVTWEWVAAEATADAPRRLRALEEAKSYFARFVDGFEQEMRLAAAQGKTPTDILEGTDFPSFSVGSLQLALVTLRTSGAEAALPVLRRLRAFLKQHPNAIKEFPVLSDHLQQCNEFIGLVESSAGSAATLPSSRHRGDIDGGDGTRHVDPDRDVVAGVAALSRTPLPRQQRLKATRPVGGTKHQVK